MTLGFVIFYRVRELSPKELADSRKKWREFKQKKWPEKVKLVGEYDHAFGVGYSGFLVIESPDFETFLKFYREFRDHNRWYVTETRTTTGVKEIR